MSLTPVLVGALHRGLFIHREKSPLPLVKRLGGPQNLPGSCGGEHFLPFRDSNFYPSVVKPVAVMTASSRFIDIVNTDFPIYT
jgi:hypothetical protein